MDKIKSWVVFFILFGLFISVDAYFKGKKLTKEEEIKASNYLLECEKVTKRIKDTRVYEDASACNKAIELLENKTEEGLSFGVGESYWNLALINLSLGKDEDYKKNLLKAYDEDYDKYFKYGISNNIGYAYSTGTDGFPQDKIKAYPYLLEAAKNGNELAQGNLDNLCRESPWVCKN